MSDECNECGRPLENTPSGLFSTCPIGHGKLMPPIMPRPFDRKRVPRDIAVCPECDGCVEIECNEWALIDGVSRPTQAGLLVCCGDDDPLGFVGNNENEGIDHEYCQCDWVGVRQEVHKWLEAVE